MTHLERNRLGRAVLAALFVFVGLASLGTSSAEAQSRRSGPLFVSAGIGPYAYFDTNTAFRLEGEFGWHPGGQDEGFFLAADLTLSFASYAQVMGGVRFGGDIEVFANNDVAVLLTPSGLAGFGMTDFGGGVGSYGFFVLQPGFQVDVGLVNRVLWLWARPIGFDLLFYPDTWHGRGDGTRGFDFDWTYQFLAGARFNFG